MLHKSKYSVLLHCRRNELRMGRFCLKAAKMKHHAKNARRSMAVDQKVKTRMGSANLRRKERGNRSHCDYAYPCFLFNVYAIED